ASFFMGLFGTALGLFAARGFFRLMHAEPGIVDAGGRYLAVVLAASPLILIANTCECVMRAAGDTRTPPVLDSCALSRNALLAPLLIFGLCPFPRLGVAGAAWATAVAQAALVGGYAVTALRGHAAFPFARRAAGPPVRLAAMARVGVPAAII